MLEVIHSPRGPLMIGINCPLIECILVQCSINMFKNRIDNYVVRAGIRRILKHIHIFTETEVQGNHSTTAKMQ